MTHSPLTLFVAACVLLLALAALGYGLLDGRSLPVVGGYGTLALSALALQKYRGRNRP